MDLLANFDCDESTDDPIIGDNILSEEHDLLEFSKQYDSAKRNLVTVLADKCGSLPKFFVDEYL